MLVVVVDLLELLAVEKGPGRQQNVKNDSGRKDVAEGSYLFALLEGGHLGSHIARSATPVKNVVLGIGVGG